MVTIYLTRRLATLRRDESGQMAFLMLVTLPIVFIFFTLAVDGGLWFFDHRKAQNQADAAVLAAINFLPATDRTEATTAVDQWLTKNGAAPGDRSCLEYSDTDGDLYWDTVRVCVGRDSPGIFSGFSGVPFVRVSAAAKARAGAAESGNVKPWAIAPEDPTCNVPGKLCFADMDGNPANGLEPCGFYPPSPPDEPICPWGMHEDRLWKFKTADKYTPGNFAPIEACGKGGGKVYVKCITGALTSGFYSVGQTIWVEIETGNLTGSTENAMALLYESEAEVLPPLPVYKAKFETNLECDVLSTPDSISGLDPDGKDLAEDAYVNNPLPGCDYRLVSIAIIDHFPSGGGNAQVLGIGTFAITRWDRTPTIGDAMGNDSPDPLDPLAPKQACGQAFTVKEGGAGGYECGQIWGYFMQDALPPNVLLGDFGDSPAPFAPILRALVE